MTTLDRDFEAKLERAVADELDDADPGQRLKDLAESNFRDYAAEHGYDIDHVWEDATLTVTNAGGGIHAEIEWPELTALFEYGVSPHTIRGNPVLHFYWEAKDQWIKTDEVNWGSETGGIPEARAIRRAMRQLQAQLQRRGPGGRFA